MPEIRIEPIGWVKNDHLSTAYRITQWRNAVSEVVLDEKHTEALEGIKSYSHIVVVFWMHGISELARSLKKICPPYAPATAGEVGVLATRIPMRPNPVGISTVPLLGHYKNILVVRDLDAYNGTPVMDIKPYTGHYLERPENFQIPEWEEYWSF